MKTLIAALMTVMPVAGQIPPALPDTLVVTERLNVKHLPSASPSPEPEPEPEPEPHVHPEPEPIPDVWIDLAICESGQNGEPRWGYSGPGFYDGGLQFDPGTWSAYAPDGFPAFAYEATPHQQVEVAERVLVDQGWGAWPTCSSKLGLR